MSNYLWPHGLSTPGFPMLHYFPEFSETHIHWGGCHPTTLSFVIPISSWLQSFSASGSFLMSQLFASIGQSIGVSASALVLLMEIQGWFPLGLTGWISLQSKGQLGSLLQHHSIKASVLRCSACFMVQLSHPYMTTRKTIALTRRTFVGKVMALLFNMLSRFVIEVNFI